MWLGRDEPQSALHGALNSRVAQPRRTRGSREKSHKEAKTGESEVDGVLEIDVVDIVPRLPALLPESQDVGAYTGADEWVGENELQGAKREVAAGLGGACRVRVDVADRGQALPVRPGQERYASSRVATNAIPQARFGDRKSLVTVIARMTARVRKPALEKVRTTAVTSKTRIASRTARRDGPAREPEERQRKGDDEIQLSARSFGLAASGEP